MGLVETTNVVFVVFFFWAGVVWLLQEEIERRNQSGTTQRPGNLDGLAMLRRSRRG